MLLGFAAAFLMAAGQAAQSPSPFEIKGPNARVSGRVIEEGTNSPVAGAKVIFAFRGRSRLQTVTDEDGRYFFDDLEPGPWRLTVQKTGYPPSESVATYWVVAGESLEIATVTLAKGARVTGRIVDSRGTPLADINVRAVKPGAALDLMSEATRTNDRGEFQVLGLAPGRYLIVASPRPFGSDALSRTMVSSTFYPGTSDPSAATMITLSAGQTIAGLEFRVDVP
jgi:hypothetical protein